jgi:hypothetical protein
MGVRPWSFLVFCHQCSDSYIRNQANVLVSEDGTPVIIDFGNSVLYNQSMQFTPTSLKSTISPRWTVRGSRLSYPHITHLFDFRLLRFCKDQPCIVIRPMCCTWHSEFDEFNLTSSIFLTGSLDIIGRYYSIVYAYVCSYH